VCEHRLDTAGTISTSNEISAAKSILQQVDPTSPL